MGAFGVVWALVRGRLGKKDTNISQKYKNNGACSYLQASTGLCRSKIGLHPLLCMPTPTLADELLSCQKSRIIPEL
jgi:hypothetical protein